MIQTPAMRKFLILPLAALLSFPAYSQAVFPEITGETVNGETVTLPNKNAKKHTIIGLAYSQKASPLLEEWYEPAYLRFVAQHGLFAGEYDADVYFIPLFVGLNKATYEPSMKRFRKSASPEIVDLVLFSKDDLEPLRATLGLDDKSVPYFFILDDQGRIIHRATGGFTDQKLEDMEDVLMN
jgi:hypothetical protein